MAVVVMTAHPPVRGGPSARSALCPCLERPRPDSTRQPNFFCGRRGTLVRDRGGSRTRAGDDRESSMQPSVPVIDLTPWLGGGETGRAGVAAQVDAALQGVGFCLITGHGVPDELRARVRAQARAFFALPCEAKQRYAVTVGGRGWLPPGVEANGYAEGTQTPPDLKESFAVGADRPTGDAAVDGYWFQPNVYPAEVPALEAAVVAYLARMRWLAGELLARWSGSRWKSNRHRVLPPQAEAPDEDLVSLVYFYEADHDAVIESLQPPIGRPNDYGPVVSAEFLKERLDAITIG